LWSTFARATYGAAVDAAHSITSSARISRLIAHSSAATAATTLLAIAASWLSDKSCYVAGETRSFARDIGLDARRQRAVHAELAFTIMAPAISLD
jgi:hypothetical protein